MVGAKISFSLCCSVSCVSSYSKAGNSSHIWMQMGEEGAHLDAVGCMWVCSTSLLSVSVPLMGFPFNVGATLFVIFTCKGELWSLLFWNQIQLLAGFFWHLYCGVRSRCAWWVLQSETGEVRPNRMHLMLSSPTHQPRKSGFFQSWHLSASSFSDGSEALVNNRAEIQVLYAGRRRDLCVYVSASVLLSPICYKNIKQGKAKIPGLNWSVAQNSGKRC